MPRKPTKISLIYFVIATLLLVGLVPLILTGWFLSDKTGKEIRSVENRYQIQLVQEKASQIEMFAQRHEDIVRSIVQALELSNSLTILSNVQTEERLGATLRDNSNLLALRLKPNNGEPISIFRPGIFQAGEIDEYAVRTLPSAEAHDIIIGEPESIQGSGEPVITIASNVFINGENAASVVAIVSLRGIARNVVGINAMSEKDLWTGGLPIIFVVDETGRVIFHPDPTLVSGSRNMSDLKIVGEWQEANSQIQSGLVPFTADFDGQKYNMIGAYSTVKFGENKTFGVITMQDERKALASVDEMRSQTWLISLAFACFALMAGLIAARLLTSPILKLSAAAEKISAGDLSTRVSTRNITEIGTLGESFNTMSDKLEEHIAKLAKAATENRELFVGTVKALAAAIDGKDKYTRGHSERVSRISVAIGRELGLEEEELETLRISALLHDVGKIAIDDNILKKPAALTSEEFEIMKTHPQRGFKIMSQIPAMKEFLPGMYMHHEMVNGKGYPQGLTDKEIPLQAKIVSVADTFDAMTIDRPYQKGMLLPDALKRIRELVGSRYDFAVVEALVSGCQKGTIGNGIVRFLANNAEEEKSDDPKIQAVA
jgi:HD-GYP domain-containing protein (c-di-GMP phosphodiesterase class II)